MESFKLHPLRLGREGPFGVPGLPLRVYPLRAPKVGEGAFYLVLEGELLIDLPQGAYLHLRRGEGARVFGPHHLVPVEGAVVLEVGSCGPTR